MTGINFNFGADPLLGGRDFSSQMSTIEQMQAGTGGRRRPAIHAGTPADGTTAAQQPQQSRTPIWDEIDSICAGCEGRFAIVSENDSSGKAEPHRHHPAGAARNATSRNREFAAGTGCTEPPPYPQTSQEASKEVDDELNDFKEYREKYAHMTYEDYSKMKREQTKSKKK